MSSSSSPRSDAAASKDDRIDRFYSTLTDPELTISAQTKGNSHKPIRSKQASSSSIADMKQSRARFAAAASSSSQREPKVERAASNSFKLSTLASEKLLSVNRLVTAHTKTPLNALERVQTVILVDRSMGDRLLPQHAISLCDAQDELLATPSALLTPELRELKLGFETVGHVPYTPRDIERRINQALLAEGEEALYMRVRYDVDPPRRLLVTAKNFEDHVHQLRARITDLGERKPKLFEFIADLWRKGAVLNTAEELKKSSDTTQVDGKFK